MPEQYDVAILMPKISNYDLTRVRYGGLMSELAAGGMRACMVETHASYQGEGVFADATVAVNPRLGSTDEYIEVGSVEPKVVRDLTMPTTPQPLYADPHRPRLVHDPDFNKILISKSSVYDRISELQPTSITRVKPEDVKEAVAAIPGDRIVVKPDTGSGGNGVLIGDKSKVLVEYGQSTKADLYIVQEAIDMSEGLVEHGVKGVHNVRFLVVGGTAIYGFVRSDPTGNLTMQNETFENRIFKPVEAFTSGLQEILHVVMNTLVQLPDGKNTVVAIDAIRGVNSNGEKKEYVLEVNRRPLRNSPHDGHDENTLWASRLWDVEEAKMLTAVASE